MGVTIYRRDRNSAQNDERTGTLAEGPATITAELNGQPLAGFAQVIGVGDELVLYVDETGGTRGGALELPGGAISEPEKV